MKLDAVNTSYTTPKVNFSGKLVPNSALEVIERSHQWKTFKEGLFYKLLESDFCSGEYSFSKVDDTGLTRFYKISRNGKMCEGIGKIRSYISGGYFYDFQGLMNALKDEIAKDFLETQNNAVKK